MYGDYVKTCSQRGLFELIGFLGVLPSIVDGLRHRRLVVREVVELVAATATADGAARPRVYVVAAHARPLENKREKEIVNT